MIAKLFLALYVGLVFGMIVLFTVNFPVAWIFYGYLFVAVFGGIVTMDRPYIIATGFLITSTLVLALGLFAIYQVWPANTWPTAPGVITRVWYCTHTVNGRVTYDGRCIEYHYRAAERVFNGSAN